MRKEIIKLKGHLKIYEITKGKKTLVVDKDNMIVTEGKAAVMDFLSNFGTSISYDISEGFKAIVLTDNDSAAALGNTFVNSVYDAVGTKSIISDASFECGVLHITGDASITHTEQTLTMTVQGTIAQGEGVGALIKSVCVCFGTSPTTGGPTDSANYSVTGDEKLFSRVNVGSLLKTNENSFTFEWVFTIS